MPWDPKQYNKFKDDRYKPFYDLINHIVDQPNMDIIDMGCGTGELTAVLLERFSYKKILGIDNSAQMLEKAPKQPGLTFDLRTIEEQLVQNEKWDLIVANASLQWVDDHERLFPKIISKLNTNGQLAVQMPVQDQNTLNRILLELVQQPPYNEALNGWVRFSPVLSLDDYTRIFFNHKASDTIIYQRVYPIVVQSHQELYEFIAGSALVPYMEKLAEPIKTQFESEFKRRISLAFPLMPAVYAFKRIILYGRF